MYPILFTSEIGEFICLRYLTCPYSLGTLPRNKIAHDQSDSGCERH